MGPIHLCRTLSVEPACPDEFIGSLAAVQIPDAANSQPPASPLYSDPLQHQLYTEYGIEVPVIPWPAPPKRLLRLSAQLYNSLPQYELLAKALRQALDVPRSPKRPPP